MPYGNLECILTKNHIIIEYIDTTTIYFLLDPREKINIINQNGARSIHFNILKNNLIMLLEPPI